MRYWILVTAFALACNGKDEEDDTGEGGGGGGGGGGDDTGSGDCTLDDYVDVTDSPTGDFTGFESGYEGNGGWVTQDVDSAKMVDVALSGDVEDFQEGTSVADATVEIWFDDTVTGAPDATGTSDSSGIVTFSEVPTCTPVTYQVTTDPDLEETKDTYEAHQVYKYTDGTLDDTFNSVSTVTYRLIPGLLGVDPDPDKGIIAGTAYDINEDPIQGAQMVVTDSSGNVACDIVIKYFVEEFPNRDQPYTSEDGLWVAINVPAGDWNVEMYVSDGAGGHMLMGATSLTVVADSINIANAFTGIGDGVKYHDSCLTE